MLYKRSVVCRESITDMNELQQDSGNTRAWFYAWYKVLFFISMSIICSVYLSISNFCIGLVIFFNSIYTISCLFKSYYFICGYTEDQYSSVILTQPEVCERYTIIVPMYKEGAVFSHLISNLSAINYPKDKLQILVVLEHDDHNTIQIARSILQNNPIFQIIIVPDFGLKTKPKACNYALQFATGDYITIYDADDKPDVNQLLEVVNKFQNSTNDLACVQARLNYYNAQENWLTQSFSIEYMNIFNYLLPAFAKNDIFIPLGGTSNHFRAAVLKQLRWNPYNLTEDADLGVRLQKHGYRTCIISSYTMEEAPITFKSWVKQRSRWNKGFLQTYLEHASTKLNFKNFLAMHVLFCFNTISAIGCCLVPPMLFFLDSELLKAISISNLLLFTSTSILQAHLIAKKGKLAHTRYITILYPMYLLMQVAPALRSIWQLCTQPYHWEKTEHGVSDYHKDRLV